MINIPVLPLSADTREWFDFCVAFYSEVGVFIAAFEEKWTELGRKKTSMGAAYEATEMLYGQLYGHKRRYKDREVFYAARSQYYSNNK